MGQKEKKNYISTSSKSEVKKISLENKNNKDSNLVQYFIIIENDTTELKDIKKLKAKWVSDVGILSEQVHPVIYTNVKGYIYYRIKKEYQNKARKLVNKI